MLLFFDIVFDKGACSQNNEIHYMVDKWMNKLWDRKDKILVESTI